MKLVECSCCRSKELFEENGYAVCSFCQSRFSLEADDGPARTAIVSVSDDIAALLAKCERDPANRRRYANLVLDIDPTNREAMRYLQ